MSDKKYFAVDTVTKERFGPYVLRVANDMAKVNEEETGHFTVIKEA
jgi:hypothetical protein